MDSTLHLDDSLYQALFDQTSDGVFVIDLSLNIVKVNMAGANMLGYSPEEMLEMSLNDIVALVEMDDGQGEERSGDTAVYERIYRRKDASTFPVELSISFVYNEQGQPTYILNIVRDITLRKQFEIELMASERRNRAIVDAFPDMVLRLTINGVILDASVAEDHPLYLEQEEVFGKALTDIWTKEFSDIFINHMNSIANTGDPQLFETKYSDNEEIFEIRLHAIGQDQILAIIRDVSQRAHLEQMKSDFINRASHELRTPLTTAILMAELIQDGGTEEEIEEFWQIMKSELNRQKNLIDSFLMAGRLEKNKLLVHTRAIDIIPIIHESIASLKPIAREKNVQLNLIAADDYPQILGDVQGLQQVFINLLSNAVKFSPENSTITLNASMESHHAVISIKDQGLGIPAKDIPHLFERFFRARNVTIAEIPGSGVGLYLVKSILNEIGGHIVVESEENQGSKFIITLQLV